VRFLADCATPYDVAEGLHALRVAAKARTTHMTMPLPMAPSYLEEWAQIVSFDGVTKDGETALFVCLSRRMQDALLSDPVPFLHALIGLMDKARRDVFVPGRMESVQTVVQVRTLPSRTLPSQPSPLTLTLSRCCSRTLARTIIPQLLHHLPPPAMPCAQVERNTTYHTIP
jgi:hypothetical protein